MGTFPNQFSGDAGAVDPRTRLCDCCSERLPTADRRLLLMSTGLHKDWKVNVQGWGTCFPRHSPHHALLLTGRCQWLDLAGKVSVSLPFSATHSLFSESLSSTHHVLGTVLRAGTSALDETQCLPWRTRYRKGNSTFPHAPSFLWCGFQAISGLLVCGERNILT